MTWYRPNFAYFFLIVTLIDNAGFTGATGTCDPLIRAGGIFLLQDFRSIIFWRHLAAFCASFSLSSSVWQRFVDPPSLRPTCLLGRGFVLVLAAGLAAFVSIFGSGFGSTSSFASAVLSAFGT